MCSKIELIQHITIQNYTVLIPVLYCTGITGRKIKPRQEWGLVGVVQVVLLKLWVLLLLASAISSTVLISTDAADTVLISTDVAATVLPVLLLLKLML